MKKIILSSLLASLMTLPLSADFIRIEGAIGMWDADPSGTMSYNNAPKFDLQDTTGYSSENITYAWFFIKHPVPILPNVRLEYNNLGYSGTSKQGFEWAGENIGVGAHSELDLTQYDAILYYNVFDNLAWITVDLGLDVKFIQSSFDIDDPSDGYTYRGSDDLILPMLYGRTRFEIPKTNIGLEGDVKWIGYTDNDAYDIRIKVDYTFDIFAVKPMIEVGYRAFSLQVDAADFDINANANIDSAGIYYGIGLRY
jgi:outer membrane protein